jgi:lipoprotein-anchoring transpeptidase ErfK/SrfK
MRKVLAFAAALAAVVAVFGLTSGAAQARGDMVPFSAGYRPGTIVVATRERRLYFTLGNGSAISYPVGVGRAGMQWSGASTIDGKYIQPAWEPPADIRRENPKLPPMIPGGSPHNPMGVAAMTVAGTDYAIHGTNEPGKIGHFVSHGCIRMYNEDVMELFEHVPLGTPVVVVQ